MDEIIMFLLNQMSDEEIRKLYEELVNKEDELNDKKRETSDDYCDDCEYRDRCEYYNNDDDEAEDNEDCDDCCEVDKDDDCNCDCESFKECFKEFCDSHNDCIDCELEDECFKAFCDSHESCDDCSLFDICFKEAFGHKYTIADEIEEVRFNGPATIVFWKDGTKTVSVCSEYDEYDPEKALAMCMLKKILGNSDYNEVFKRFIPEEEFDLSEDEIEELHRCNCAINDAFNTIADLFKTKKLTEHQKDAIRLLIPEIDNF